MKPPDNTAATAADDTAAGVPTPPDLGDLRKRAEQTLADRRGARREVEKRIDTELNRLSEQLVEELQRRRDESDEQAKTELGEERQEFEQQRDEWDAVRADVEKELAAREQRLVAREGELNQALADVKQEKRDLDHWAGELADERLAIEELKRDADHAGPPAESPGIADALRAARERASSALAERDELAARVEAVEKSHAAALAAVEADLDAEKARLGKQLEEARDALANAAQRDAEAAAGDSAALAELQQRLEAAEAEWDAERERLTRDRADLADSLAEAGSQLEHLRTESDGAESELRGKFELAQSDVERLRGRVDELEQELAERPAPGAAEAAELAALRIDRDELAQQLETLRAAPAGGQQDSQEIDDLRRRFEMAVDDVRQLKTENAELQERLSAGGGASSGGEGTGLDGGAMDWEAQKRRLLASLEGEGEPTTPQRREERSTIEGTIRITDEVVAEKDRLIAELREQLAQAQAGGGPPAAPADEPSLSDDARFEAERQRLADLEHEWCEKLRAAELELSVERAKIAREQAELADTRAELESLRGSTPTDDGKGQRRWLDKLGLNNSE